MYNDFLKILSELEHVILGGSLFHCDGVRVRVRVRVRVNLTLTLTLKRAALVLLTA